MLTCCRSFSGLLLDSVGSLDVVVEVEHELSHGGGAPHDFIHFLDHCFAATAVEGLEQTTCGFKYFLIFFVITVHSLCVQIHCSVMGVTELIHPDA